MDAGGPCREYFRLLMQEIMNNNNLFQGEMYVRLPCHNMKELECGTFKVLGQMMSLSIVHDGPGPQCLAGSVVDYLLYGLHRVHASVEDVPDYSLKLIIKKVIIIQYNWPQHLLCIIETDVYS